ncbi:MAG: DNA mismatch repair protein MutS [Erysipelotrichaceae bacterium]|nr:DNA mismatch repair protein MutS [Erysipelotrichaceae bacterium]
MEQYTPMMQQYLQVKEGYKDALVFYRLGDFYEMFFDDARIASSELDLVLTGRNAGVEEKVPMCGVPFHAVDSYIQRLVQRGYKVAIVEQMEDPATAKGIVKRDVIKVVTPGTLTGDSQEDKNSIYIAGITDYQYGYVVICVEMSTGETTLMHISHTTTSLIQTLLKNNIKEVVVHNDFAEKAIKEMRELGNVVISYCDEQTIKDQYLPLCEKLKEDRDRETYGILLNYLEATQKKMLDHLQMIDIEDENSVLYMDFNTQQNLELIVPLRSQARTETLWTFMDKCQSAMGSRLLKKWIEKPLVNQAEIELRYDRVEWLNKHFMARSDLKEALGGIYDIQRLIARVAMMNANATDCIRLGKTLAQVPTIFKALKNPVFDEFTSCDPLTELYDLLKDAFVDNPPVTTREGGMFREGYNSELDEVRAISSDNKSWIAACENKERERTGIRNLKIGYNRVFGYYIEVSKANLSMISDDFGYIRKQTLVNAERFITQELKEKEDAILHAQERAIRLESELFAELIGKIKTYLPKLQKLSMALAAIDCYYAMSTISSDYGYVRPKFDEKLLKIKDGKHPILDQMMKDRKYVANDLIMDDERNILIITGPNMGGKSTYMRQVALTIIMAQMGCFVPCKSITMPVFDKIFTRIGASDDILSGQSTFMVEMNEANHALMNATSRSFILFDEIGRGTSTYDGMALAQAMIEYLATCVHAKTLFSTHYHELTSLEGTVDGVHNVHVEVHEADGQVTFMYRVAKGKADRSYGINVARLAHLPDSLLERARQLLGELESKKRVVQQSYQLIEMTKANDDSDEIREMLEAVDPNNMTPMAALQMIADMKNKLKK